MAKLSLIPSPISEDLSFVSSSLKQVISNQKVFICERIRTSRRFIKSILPDFDIDGAVFLELDKKTAVESQQEIIRVFKSGKDVALLSEAGTPCIADPGAEIVHIARENGYQIRPFTGPNAIVLALMSSGLNGQQFTFHGYLAVKADALKKELKKIEQTAISTGYSQIFIETPYRNEKLFLTLLALLKPATRLHISYNIHSDGEYMDTKTIRAWKNDKTVRKKLKKKAPCMFIIGR